MKKTLLLCGLVALVGCRTPGSKSALKAGNEGPAYARPGWIKTPEAIEGTITKAWGLSLTEKDRWKYLQSMYSMLGGTLVLNTKSLVDQPNELFVLGLDNLSTWLAGRLVEKQGELTGQSKTYLFEGLGFAEEDSGNCFADDAKDWCDFLDGVKLTSLTDGNVNPASLSKQWKKRLMHNIQDVGEFMLLAVDNTVKMPGSEKHAAQYLLDEVFLPTFGGAAATKEKEAEAWKNVAYTILMSGGFYLEAPVEGAQ